MPPIRRSCILALALVAGCATQAPPPPSAAANARALEARTLDGARLKRFVAAGRSLAGAQGGAEFWDLDSLSLAALYYHPQLDLARSRLAEARARSLAARSFPNPSGSLDLSYDTTTKVPSPWTVGLMVEFIIETFDRRSARIAQAAHLEDAAREDLASATWQVRADVRDALLAIWSAGRRLELAKEQFALRGRLARLVERRFDAGATSALEVGRARMAANRAKLAADSARRDRAAARSRLAQAIGVPLRALDGAKISLAAFDARTPLAPDVSTGALRDAALTRRSDVQALLAEYEAAQSALALELARRAPNLRLGPGYTYDQGDHKYGLSLGAELPVFNRNEGPIAQAEARRAVLAARFDALQAEIIGALDAAASAYRAGSRSLATAGSLVAAAQDRLAGIRRAFGAGQLGRPALLDAEIELGAAQAARLEARAAERRAVAALEDALREPLFGRRAALPVEERNPRMATENRK